MSGKGVFAASSGHCLVFYAALGLLMWSVRVRGCCEKTVTLWGDTSHFIHLLILQEWQILCTHHGSLCDLQQPNLNEAKRNDPLKWQMWFSTQVQEGINPQIKQYKKITTSAGNTYLNSRGLKKQGVKLKSEWCQKIQSFVDVKIKQLQPQKIHSDSWKCGFLGTSWSKFSILDIHINQNCGSSVLLQLLKVQAGANQPHLRPILLMSPRSTCGGRRALPPAGALHASWFLCF